MDAVVSPTLPDWKTLLVDAVRNPGKVSGAYSAFWKYSLGNQMLAYTQCLYRGIAPGPLAPFKTWIKRGRCVRKGEKALTLCMPIIKKAKTPEQDDAVFFAYKSRWFVYSQTDGEPWQPEPSPTWDAQRALAALDMRLVPFTNTDGNTQGESISSTRTIAINPLAEHPDKTLVHEMAHVLFEHVGTGQQDIEQEVEAELVAYLCAATLELDGLDESRGYVQYYLGVDPRANLEQAWRDRLTQILTDAFCRKIMHVANRIVAAGRPPVEEAGSHDD